MCKKLSTPIPRSQQKKQNQGITNVQFQAAIIQRSAGGLRLKLAPTVQRKTHLKRTHRRFEKFLERTWNTWSLESLINTCPKIWRETDRPFRVEKHLFCWGYRQQHLTNKIANSTRSLDHQPVHVVKEMSHKIHQTACHTMWRPPKLGNIIQ